ncbi:MAG: hypothetical protein IT381_29215 [Deltaproteobacteria bacterium]|nr:hypothetical protein [Deltaproteobacteria bacterium]
MNGVHGTRTGATGSTGSTNALAKTVPGGTFDRDNDPAYPATISTFDLDVHEVTVGFANEAFYELTTVRIDRSPEIADYDVGIRCAR